jgi:hypothetical protein
MTANLTSAGPSSDLPPARSESEVTPWFPAIVKPARIGWYEVMQHDRIIGKARWTGRQWTNVPVGYISHFWGDKWRGLASNPAA